MKTQQTSYEKGFGLIEILLLVVIVGLVGLVAWQLYQAHHSPRSTPTVSSTQTSTSQQPQQTTLSSGTDNPSLTSDLNTIDNGLSQNNQNLNASDGSVNDQPNQISIPTN